MEVRITNAGDREVCGIYCPESKQTWRQGNFYLQRFPLRNEWVIVHQQESSARYAVSSNATSPPYDGWRVCKRGKTPAPRLSSRDNSSRILSTRGGSIAIVGNGQIVGKGIEIDRADKVVRFNHGIFHDESASKDIGRKTSTWVFTDMSWRMYREDAIAFVKDNPCVELICFNPHHPQHTATLHKECPRPFELLTLNDIRCASCHRFRTWHKTHCCAGCACGQGHDAACLTKCPTTGLRYLIHEEGDTTLYGFDAFKSGHYGDRFPLRQSSLGYHDVACEPRIINILQRQRIAPPQVVYAGIYSGKYEGQYNALYTQLTAQGVQETNIMFKRVTQETFRLRQNCFWCGKSCHFAFHHGETCKIDFQLELYKRFVNRNVIIIFLDVDVELHSNIPDWSAVLGEYEIAFEREGDKASARWVSNINIGFTMCRPAENVIQFYETVLHTLRQRKPPLNWDQQVVNEMFKNQAPLRMKLLKGGEETGFKHARAGGGSKSNLKMSTSKAKELATVAVVGSTNIVLCGSEIESADTVIRVGNEPQNDARNIGSRTDLCVQSLGDAMSHLKEPNIKISLFGFDNRMVSRFLSDLRVTIGKSVMRIPIAEDCYSTRMLGKMRVSATPFDWIVLSPRTVMELIRSDFHDFLEDVVLHKQNTRVHFVKNAWDGTDTVKNTVEFWDRRHSILVPHHMTSISELPALRAKMRERINRMYADMKVADEIEFWYKPTSEKELSGLPNKSGFGEDEMRKVEYELVRLVCERFHKRDSDVRVCYS